MCEGNAPWVAKNTAHALVTKIFGAKKVSMRKADAPGGGRENAWVCNQLGVNAGQCLGVDEKIAISMHEVELCRAFFFL